MGGPVGGKEEKWYWVNGNKDYFVRIDIFRADNRKDANVTSIVAILGRSIRDYCNRDTRSATRICDIEYLSIVVSRNLFWCNTAVGLDAQHQPP